MTNTIALETRGLTKTYYEGENAIEILKGVDLQVTKGEMLAIMGASGSGKSTLLHILGLLDNPTTGTLLIDGQDVSALNENQRSMIRNQKLGFVYQFHHLLPEFTVLDNVAMPLILRRQSRAVAREQAMEVIDKVGLNQRALFKPGQLSGGERQRIALARALVTRPVCVLADEPTGNLDRATTFKMYDFLTEVNHLFQTAFLIVTHDPELARQASRCLYMDSGVLMSGY